MDKTPNRAAMLNAPDEAFHDIAPQTLIYAAAGTRRAANRLTGKRMLESYPFTGHPIQIWRYL